MVDITYEPSSTEDEVLLVVKQEERVNTQRVHDRTAYDPAEVSDCLETLVSHGWVQEVTTDLYEFVDDPRETDTRLEQGMDINEDTQTAPIDPKMETSDSDSS
jgi:DNA-binding IclR family transcriptional regulator